MLGPDVAWQINDAWRVRGQWLHSDTTAQLDPHGGVLVRGKSTAGDSVMLKASRNTDRLQFDFTDLDISPQFRHDSGFVNQVGMRDIELHQAYVYRNLAHPEAIEYRELLLDDWKAQYWSATPAKALDADTFG